MPDFMLEILVIFLLTLANGFFAASELAIVQARRNRLEAEAEAGNTGARKALALASQPDRFLATVQVGITLISTFSAAFGGARLAGALAEVFRNAGILAGSAADTVALLLVVAVLTYMSLVFGELVPKRLALQNAERLAIFAAPFLDVLMRLARPPIAVLSASVRLVSRLIGVPEGQGNDVTEADIMSLVREGAESGAVESEQAEIIQQVFQFSNRAIRSVMTQRSEIVALSVESTLEEIVTLLDDTRVSRVPIYEGNLDGVLGILLSKDLVRYACRPADDFELRKLLLPAQFVPESARVDDVMEQLRSSGTHLALVIDEYGAVSGLVTLEDVLEELVGEIKDEYDQAEEPELQIREDGSWLVDGAMSLERLNATIGGGLVIEVDSGFSSVGGLILAALNRIPSETDTVHNGRFILEVMDMDGRRIDKVLVRLAPPEEPPGESPNSGGDAEESGAK